MGTHYAISGVTVAGTVLAARGQTRTRGFEVVTERDSGQEQPRSSLVLMESPEFEFETPHIEALLGLISVLGSSIAALSGGVVLHGKQLGTVGAASGTVHETFTVSAGVIVIDSIQARPGAKAVATVKVVPESSDGVTSPVTHASNAALPTIPDADEFTLGPVFRAGTQLADVTGWTLNMNPQIEKEMDSGLPYPVKVFLRGIAPEATVETRNILEGLADESASRLFLRHVGNRALPTANASTEHVRLEMTKCAAVPVSNSGQDRQSAQLRMIANATSSTACLVATTGVAIAGS